MPNLRQLFLQHVAQTSRLPMGLEIERAEGMFIYDHSGKQYLDLNAGICVSALGHCHPAVVKAVKDQVERYMHTMVYGEHIQAPQVQLATLLAEQLPDNLDSVYFLNSGSEAVEGAMKLAKRVTGRYDIIAARNAYHGSTQGADSLRSDRELTSAFRPLLPGIRHINFNDLDDLNHIDNHIAAVIIEPVQAEAGVIPPNEGYLEAVREACDRAGALLILDEIQTGYGRTGSLFAFQKYGVVPDILLTGKAMGGGMPISAFIASHEMMQTLAFKPALGHITTFGGHPVSCAAALACLQTLLDSDLISRVPDHAKVIKSTLEEHPLVDEVRHAGLMMAVSLKKKRHLKYVVNHSLENGAIIDWFLFNHQAFRLAPPLIISDEERQKALQILLRALDYASQQ